MAELLGNRLFTALDDDGAVISGARALFYLTGTTTAADVYEEAGLTTPHAQPVLCDAAGRLPDVYLDPAVSYKMVLQDADSVAIRTIDPVATVNLGGVDSTAWAVGFLSADDAGDAIDALGIVNIYDETTISATLTIGSGFPAAYKITDSGSPADYNIFLPTGASNGSLVFFRVDSTATKLFTLYDGSTWEDGDDRYIMQGGETVMLLKVSGAWKIISARRLPIHGVLKRTSALSLTTGVEADITFASCVGNLWGRTHGLNSGRFLVPRKGLYQVTLSLATLGSADGQLSQVKLAIGGPAVTQPAPVFSAKNDNVGGNTVRVPHQLTTLVALLRGTGEVIPKVTVVGTTPSVEYAAGTVECELAFTEIVT